MFTFQQNKSAECQPCPVEVFKSLTQAQLTAETIDEHRRLKACGKLKEAREKKDSCIRRKRCWSARARLNTIRIRWDVGACRASASSMVS